MLTHAQLITPARKFLTSPERQRRDAVPPVAGAPGLCEPPPSRENIAALTRRHFLRHCGAGLGTVALASLLNPDLFAQPTGTAHPAGVPHFAPRARRVIFLF